MELGLADIVEPVQVGAPDSRVQGCQGPETCPGLGRPLRFLTGLCQDERVACPLRRAPGLLRGVAGPALGEHLQADALELARVPEALLDAVRPSRQSVIAQLGLLLGSGSLLPEWP